MLRGLVSSGERLDASSFNPLLNLHARSGQPGRALAILKLMESADVQPSLITFNSLAAACGGGRHQIDQDALNQAKGVGLCVDRYSYGALLQVASKAAGKANSNRDNAAKQAAQAAGLKYAEAMLKSGIEMNDFLVSTASACGRPASLREAARTDSSWRAERSGGGRIPDPNGRGPNRRAGADRIVGKGGCGWLGDGAVDSALVPQCLLFLSPEGRCHATEQRRSCRLRP